MGEPRQRKKTARASRGRMVGVLPCLLFTLFAAQSWAAIIPVNCSSASLQTAVNAAAAGDTIQVSGICSENILVRNEKQRITLDGGGSAVINGPSAASPTVNVRGKGILIQGFHITGGSNGIEVNRGSNAVIQNNTIHATGASGIVVYQLAYAVITNNVIEDNPGDGIEVNDASASRVGFNNDGETVASGNTIQANEGRGISLFNASSARIVGNAISFNADHGVLIARQSHADIAANAISANGGNGIEVDENSSVQLGDVSPDIFGQANASPLSNAGVGLRCSDGSAVVGTLGGLMGAGGATSFDGECKAHVNRSPVAVDDFAVTTQNVEAIVSVLGNDSDPDGDLLTVISFTQGAHGGLNCTGAGSCSYTPNQDFVGTDAAAYTISDGKGGTASATIHITVNPSNTLCSAPTITSISPLSGPVGTEVTITGNNLDCGNSQNLTLNGTQLVITSLSPTEVKTFIPIGGQDGVFTLITDGGSVTQQQLGYDVVLSQDFQVNVLPPSASAMQGASTNYIIEVASVGATPFSGTAVLSASGLPVGASAFFSPAIVTAGQKATLTITTAGGTPLGSSSFQVNAAATIDGQAAVKFTSVQLQVLPAGTTALTGSVLDTEGNPIQGVTIRIGSIPSQFEAVTNEAGSFLLPDPPSGTQLVFVDGQTVPNIKYPTIPINVTITAGTVNQLPFTPFLHVQKDQSFTQIDPLNDTIVTDPELPGVTLTIPAGTSIIGWDGQANQKVSMRAVPVDRLPIPPPPPEVLTNVVYMFYFGKVGGGVPSQPIPFSAPNDLGMDPGDQAELWYYDESPVPGGAPNDWRMAGLGTVSADGTTIVSDPGVGIPKFCCGAAAWNKKLANHGQAPGRSSPMGAEQPGADPVDLATGIFTLTETDMVLSGRIPVIVTRTYRSGDFAVGPFGRGTTMSYDDILPLTAPGVLTYVYRGSARTQFFLQGDGSYVNNTVPAFRGARITIDGSTGVRTLRHRNGSSIDFDASGLMIAVRDRNGNQVTISRSFGLKATQITDSVSRLLTFTKSGDLETALTDPLGRTVSYVYDGGSRLIKVTRPDGSTTQYGYDGLHRMTSITDGRGIVYLKNSYDVNSRVCQQEQADGGKYKMYYVTTDGASLPASIQLLQQAAAGGPISMPPCSSTFSTGAVAATVLVDPMGHPTTYRFNGSGFLISTTNALGQTTSMFRDSVTNQILSSTDPLGRTTQFEYDAAGNVTKITDPAGNVRLVEYDPVFSEVTKTTDPLGNITTFEYDNKGNLIALTDPEQNLKPEAQRLKTTLAYNPFGQPSNITDVLGNGATFAYDSLGNLATITDPLGNATHRNFDLVSRLISHTDPRGKTTKIGYDSLDRATQIVDALNGFTSFSYDANGNLVTVTDARANTVAYTYDTMDRLASRVDQLKHSDTFNYDLNGNLGQRTDRKGQVSAYQYDALNRRIGGSYADGTSVQYQFDAGGRLVRAKDSVGGDLLLGYDGLDRLIVSSAELGTVRYAYDKIGRRTSMIASGQPTVTYGYDANSRLRQVVKGTQIVNLDYDALNRRTKLTLPNGVATEYFYDAASRIIELIYENAGGVLGNLTYAFDSAGNRRGVGGSFAQTLLPDPVATAEYDAANRQLQFGDRVMNYDLAGNLTSITSSSGGTSLNWDARHRLSALSSPGIAAAFSYDVLGRRRWKQISGQVAQSFYDELNPISERSSNTTNAYLGGLGVDEPWARNSNEFYLADAIGTVVGLTDAAGAIADRYSYEPFGKTSVQGSSSNALQFTARENDGTGLYYYRARYYSPMLYRFISEDPLEFRSGDINLYAYVSNKPQAATDPFGLKSKWMDFATEAAKQLFDKLREDTVLEAKELENWMKHLDFINKWGRCIQSSAAQSTTLGAQTPGYVQGNLATDFVDMSDCAAEAAKSAYIPFYDQTKGQAAPPSQPPAPAAPPPSCGAAGAAYPCDYRDPTGNRYHLTGPRSYDVFCPANGQACVNRTVRY